MARVHPRATYRLQLHAGFGFADARRLVPYLASIGISHLYLSPVSTARKGSLHGYDVTDPTTVNPELGGRDEFDRLVEEAGAQGVGVVLDIVPNHMAASEENRWWRDVLTFGPRSAFAGFFDIDWAAEGGRVLLPMLGKPYAEAVTETELRLVFDDGWIWVAYYERRLPLRPESVARLVLNAPMVGEPRAVAEAVLEVSPEAGAAEYRQAGERLREALLEASPGDTGTIGDAAGAYTGEDLHAVLREQHYRLVFWRAAAERINYRRFFDINELAGVRVEHQEVFDASHSLIRELVQSGKVQGLRVDHIDGLADPEAYTKRLAAIGGDQRRPYIVVEKILGDQEELPLDWEVAGTTGYEFGGILDRLFVEAQGLPVIDEWYRELAPLALRFPATVRYAKAEVLEETFPGEVERLTAMLERLANDDFRAVDLTRSALREALVQLTTALPRYRTYVTERGISESDRRVIEETARAAIAAGGDERAVDFIKRMVLRPDDPVALAFTTRWQQLTGPAAAKGLEDTALYRDNRLLVLNDVGRSPNEDLEGIEPEGFHGLMQRRAERWQGSLNTTSTHDTKRSEDVRYRMAVISELADEWRERFWRWREMNAPFRGDVDGDEVPRPTTEAGFYQVLAGAWPASGAIDGAFIERMQRYAIKAARERGLRTSWVDQDRAYEEALAHWIGTILDRREDPAFIDDVTEFSRKLAWFGGLNALSAMLLKITAPGVPDFYQGSELPLLSLVDPDNRRPVDFQRRREILESGAAVPAAGGWWQRAVHDGRGKMAVMLAGLAVRGERPQVFQGDYQPLQVAGERANHIVAFARRHEGDRAIVVAPRLYASLCAQDAIPHGSDGWGATRIELPEHGPTRWSQRIGDAHEVLAGDRWLLVSDALARAPVALLTPAG